jgi:predicted nucleic acid-binding Zn ribbon protein
VGNLAKKPEATHLAKALGHDERGQAGEPRATQVAEAGGAGSKDRGGGPRKLAESLAQAAALAGAAGALELASLEKHWVAVVGADVAAHSRPTKVENGVLTVVTDHHAWAAELRLLSSHLLDRARPFSPSLRSVRVRLGSA